MGPDLYAWDAQRSADNGALGADLGTALLCTIAAAIKAALSGTDQGALWKFRSSEMGHSVENPVTVLCVIG